VRDGFVSASEPDHVLAARRHPVAFDPLARGRVVFRLSLLRLSIRRRRRGGFFVPARPAGDRSSGAAPRQRAATPLEIRI
ncbi:MAG: hypothetical protein ACK51C_08095, partial [Brevundimonas sp.]|uniref:hypothetical protein n=1 Tax=Brevundimonas sp. TaxID=1871086 RepID=UPI00391F8E8E